MGTKVEIAGKVALITGGARGMGKLWAEHLARDGAKIVLWDLDDTQLTATANQLIQIGTQVMTQVVDVTDRQAVYQAADAVAAELGMVDILINNAGIVVGGPFLDTPDEKLSATIDIDLKALMWTIKAFLPAMIKKGQGHIINVSSASGFIGVPFMPAYVASKWGVIGLTDSLRLEMELLGHKNITFTLFCPSYINTGMFEGVKAPLLVPILSPEEAVAGGYRAFRKGQYVIKMPFMVKFTPALRALLPTSIFDRISRFLGVTTSMESWSGHGK